MVTQFEIIDISGALEATSKLRRSGIKRLLSALSAIGGAVFVLALLEWTPLFHTVFLLGVGLNLLDNLRGDRTYKLRVTDRKFSYRSLGSFSTFVGLRRTLKGSEVKWLEYDETSSEDHYPGLYAVLRFRTVCILPHIDGQQSLQVIDRIESRFPAYQEQWKGQSAFGKQFITLGLDQSAADDSRLPDERRRC
jgi:hypothetical protein